MNKNDCPYRSTSNNMCVHKGMNTGKSKKVFCPLKNAIKCPYYIEWLDERKSILEGLE